jgi:hypothetical protein
VPSSSLGQRDEGGVFTQMPGGLVTKAVGECAARVVKFVSLGDSSCDICGPCLLKKMPWKMCRCLQWLHPVSILIGASLICFMT